MFKNNPQNSVPQCFATKLIRQQRLQIVGNHVSVRNDIQYYPHSDIRSLGTLNTTFLALSRACLNLYNTSDDQGSRKSSQFTAAVWPPSSRQKIVIRLVFWWSSLTFCHFLLSLHLIHHKCDNEPYGSIQSTYLCKWIKGSITNSDINSIRTFCFIFPALLHARLDLYSNVENQGGNKSGRF